MTMLGCDPEASIWGPGGVFYPAHMFNFPHKNTPKEVVDGHLLRDGFSIEFNPLSNGCRAIATGRFWSTMIAAIRMLPGKHYPTLQSAVPVDLEMLAGAPMDVAEFGCEGAYNAYKKEIVKPKIHGPTHPWRYNGGHIHQSSYGHRSWPSGVVSLTPDLEWYNKPEDVFLWAKMQDRYLGQVSTYLTGSEWSALRRRYYGQAGEFRYQNHSGYVAALEYRTPGAEIFCNHALTSLCYGLARVVYEHFKEFKERYDPTKEKEVRKVIDAGLSHDDNLDLIPELPGWYTRKLLKRARKTFSRMMHTPITAKYAKGQYNKSFNKGYGWKEWCQSVGYTHYREDYRGGDRAVVIVPGMNRKWEGK